MNPRQIKKLWQLKGITTILSNNGLDTGGHSYDLDQWCDDDNVRCSFGRKRYNLVDFHLEGQEESVAFHYSVFRTFDPTKEASRMFLFDPKHRNIYLCYSDELQKIIEKLREQIREAIRQHVVTLGEPVTFVGQAVNEYTLLECAYSLLLQPDMPELPDYKKLVRECEKERFKQPLRRAMEIIRNIPGASLPTCPPVLHNWTLMPDVYVDL